MLDMAELAPEDFVIDLGSGDGRAVIAAAKRGVRALGVEYEGRLVELSRERAAEAGVGDRAAFEQGDMYEADISKASVLILFLMSENLDRLTPKFLDMAPGSRIVINYYTVSGWDPDRSERIADCKVWCTAHLYVVPAKVGGTWKIGNEALTLRQVFQTVSGTLTSGRRTLPIAEGRLRGDRISFLAGNRRYEGRVIGDRIVGETGAAGESWTAEWLRPN
jgi:SAM-dependent methyltransferase